MTTGPERLVLAECDELAGNGYGFVLDSDVAGKAGMSLGTVQDCLRGLARDGFVDLAPLENGALRASVTPRGRQELIRDRGGIGTPILKPRKERQINVVPKGLRSYDEHDAEFFLELLPGPRRSDGLPESIHFWKTRIEEKDPDRTFRVGLIYGPSGCGKSSLVKAGLLPRLAVHVQSVYVEASADDTEARILKELRKRFPNVSADLGLVETLAALCGRQAIIPGQKALIILDQFEQWLHAKSGEEDKKLFAALRQCDGGNVQTLVLVRDDFWMAVNRFEILINVVFRRDHNSYGVDLFDQRHAKKVLAAFGRAYGMLQDELTDSQQAFLDLAVEGMAQEGKVIPVRLALLSEMFRGREWSPKSLKEVGGAEGVGVAFLEETFGSKYAAPKYRHHQQAVQGVFKVLLSECVSNFKGRMRSYGELLEASGYSTHPEEFNDLVRILDGETRLITPTEPEREQDQPYQQFFQLTHEYLVPSLREWLVKTQGKTRKGRAELRLQESTALTKTLPARRHLPSLSEWASIIVYTDWRQWTNEERAMMNRTMYYHIPRIIMGILLSWWISGIIANYLNLGAFQ